MSFIYCSDKIIDVSKKTIMGIVNITPDSFSDGQEYLLANKAVNKIIELFQNGADIVDIGALATNPLAKEITEQEELSRVLPVLKIIYQENIKYLSIDTKSYLVAKIALEHGVSWLNDQSAGLHDANMAFIMNKFDAVILMHSLATASGVEAGENVKYKNIIDDIKNFFHERLLQLNISKKKVIFDPGIGFSKGLTDSLHIIKNINQFNELGFTLLGLSRKSFLGKLFAIENPKERDAVTLGANIAALTNGCNIIRTHNVLLCKQFLMAFDACLGEK